MQRRAYLLQVLGAGAADEAPREPDDVGHLVLGHRVVLAHGHPRRVGRVVRRAVVLLLFPLLLLARRSLLRCHCRCHCHCRRRGLGLVRGGGGVVLGVVFQDALLALLAGRLGGNTLAFAGGFVRSFGGLVVAADARSQFCRRDHDRFRGRGVVRQSVEVLVVVVRSDRRRRVVPQQIDEALAEQLCLAPRQERDLSFVRFFRFAALVVIRLLRFFAHVLPLLADRLGEVVHAVGALGLLLQMSRLKEDHVRRQRLFRFAVLHLFAGGGFVVAARGLVLGLGRGGVGLVGLFLVEGELLPLFS
mmetsp:Transcript_17234/g.52380  ORF Transcript_17234/g.52380 Transcript_17234/m.52380 type:complete len:303 (-) Transcript_17234:549-1457(-)